MNGLNMIFTWYKRPTIVLNYWSTRGQLAILGHHQQLIWKTIIGSISAKSCVFFLHLSAALEKEKKAGEQEQTSRVSMKKKMYGPPTTGFDPLSILL